MESGYLVRILLCLVAIRLYTQGVEQRSSDFAECNWRAGMVFKTSITGRSKSVDGTSARRESHPPEHHEMKSDAIFLWETRQQTETGRLIAGVGGFRIVEPPLRRRRFRQGV